MEIRKNAVMVLLNDQELEDLDKLAEYFKATKSHALRLALDRFAKKEGVIANAEIRST